MNLSIRALRSVLVGLALLGPLTGVPLRLGAECHVRGDSALGAAHARATSVLRRLRLHRVPRRSRHCLSRRLQFRGTSKKDAETATKRASGINEVWIIYFFS